VKADRLNPFRLRQSLSAKFLLAFILLILMPSFAVGIWYYVYLMQETRDERLSAYWSNLTHTEKQVSNVLQNAVTVANQVSANDEVTRIINRIDQSQSWGNQYDDLNRLTRIMDQYQTYENIYRLRMHLTPAVFYANQNIYFCDLTRLNENGIYQRIIDEGRNYLWYLRRDYRETPYEQPVSQIGYFVQIRKLSASGSINTIVIEADILESILYDATRQFFLYNNSALYLIDDKGVIVSAVDKSMLGQPINTIGGLDQMPDIGVHPTNEGSYILRKDIPINNWSIVVKVSTSALSEYDALFKTVFLLLIFELILVFLVTTVFFLRLNKRIRKLATSMSNIRHYDHMPMLNDHRKDEIGLLTQCFNGMVCIVRNMINDVRRISEEKRATEISLLLSQINPHFIYNALESINSKAIHHEAYDISKSIIRISRFLRLSLSEGTQMISIGQEFTQIKLYLQIQTDLVKKHFTYALKYDEAFSAVLMPKLLLQPLVENAIIHGIMEKDADDAYIHVLCEQNTSGLTFTVFDNGAGIGKDEQEEIIKQRKSNAVPRFFALHNINQRLILKYGEDASLRIESEPGKYTKVSFTIPERI